MLKKNSKSHCTTSTTKKSNNTCLIEHSRHTDGKENTKPEQQQSSNVIMCNLTNEQKKAGIATVTAVLQGIIFQNRRIFPCYYCGEPQSLSVYCLHIDFCQARTEALYVRHGLSILRLVMHVPKQSIPGVNAKKEEVDAFIHSCYQSVKQSILSCPECGVLIRIHDFSHHKSVCKKKK